MSDRSRSSIGVCLIKILSDFGLVTDFDNSTSSNMVLGLPNENSSAITPVATISRCENDTRAFKINDELIFSYDQDAIILPENIMLHDLLVKILSHFGWIVHDVCSEPGETEDAYTKVSSAIAPKTYNVILILSDYSGNLITESRLVYCNRTLLTVSVVGKEVVINIPSGTGQLTVDCDIRVANK